MLLRGRSRIDPDHRTRVFGILADITHRKRHEAELAHYRNRLEGLVEQRTSELAHAHAELRGKERLAALAILSAGLGHEKGKLLLPLRLRIDAIRAEKTSDPVRADLESIASSVEYLQRLSNS